MLSFVFSPWRAWKQARLERSRRTFRYFDGQQIRRIDPIQATRSLQSWPDFDWDKHPKQMIEQGDESALERTLTAVRGTFGVAAYSETQPGLTQEETIGLLVVFVAYLNEQKKTGNGWLIWPRSTAEMSSPNTDTTLSSESGSTSSDSSSEPPFPSSSPSTPPSAEN